MHDSANHDRARRRAPFPGTGRAWLRDDACDGRGSLRRAADLAGEERERLAEAQGSYFDSLAARADLAVLASDEMWR
jgi:hypothetical protein